MTKTIYLIRHAEPRIEAGKKGSLTEKGQRQAHELAMILAPELQSLSDKLILYAPVARCHETAAILGKKLGASVIQAPLRLEGADKLALKEAQSKMSQYLASYKEQSIESPDNYGKRMVGYIHNQLSDVVIIVGNEVPLRLLLRFIMGEDTTTLAHAGCIKVTLPDKQFSEIQKKRQ